DVGLHRLAQLLGDVREDVALLQFFEECLDDLGALGGVHRQRLLVFWNADRTLRRGAGRHEHQRRDRQGHKQSGVNPEDAVHTFLLSSDGLFPRKPTVIYLSTEDTSMSCTRASAWYGIKEVSRNEPQVRGDAGRAEGSRAPLCLAAKQSHL